MSKSKNVATIPKHNLPDFVEWSSMTVTVMIFSAFLAKFPIHALAAAFGEFTGTLIDPFEAAFYFIFCLISLSLGNAVKRLWIVAIIFSLILGIPNAISLGKDIMRGAEGLRLWTYGSFLLLMGFGPPLLAVLMFKASAKLAERQDKHSH